MSIFNTMICKFKHIFEQKDKFQSVEKEVKPALLEQTPKVTVFLSPCATYQTPSRKRRSKSLIDYSSFKDDASAYRNISNFSVQLEHFLEDAFESSKICTNSTFTSEKDFHEQSNIKNRSFEDNLTIEYLKKKVSEYNDVIKDLRFDLMICHEIIKSEKDKVSDQNVKIEDVNNNSQKLSIQEDLKREVEALRSENAEMAEKIQELQVEEESLSKNYEDLQNEFQKYKKGVESTSKTAIEFLSNNIQLNEILKGILNNSDTMFEKLTVLIDVLDADTDDINFTLSGKKIDEFKGFFKMINDLTKDMEAMEIELKAKIESDAKRIEKCHEATRQIEESRHKITQLENENFNLQHKLNQARDFISTLRVNCREYSAELRQKNKVIVESKKQVSELINEKRLVQRKCNEVELENSTHKMKLSILEGDIKLRDEEIAGQLKILKRLETRENQVKQLENLCEVERDYSKKLKEYVEILHAKLMKERKNLQENIVAWNKEKENLNAERKRLQEKVDDSILNMGENVDRVAAKLRINYDHDFTKMKRKYEERVLTLQRQLNSTIIAKEYSERLKKENQQLNGENLDLKRKIEALNKRRTSLSTINQIPKILITKPSTPQQAKFK